MNLQEASYVFHLDRWWNPAVERQAEDRAHRMGQTVKVNVIKYSCARELLRSVSIRFWCANKDCSITLIDDISLDLSTRLSGEELFGLFGLERSAEQHPTTADVPSAETGRSGIRRQ